LVAELGCGCWPSLPMAMAMADLDEMNNGDDGDMWPRTGGCGCG